MPTKLIRRHGSPNWYIRGSVRGIAVDESTRTADKGAAETLRARREWEILQSSIFGRKATAGFLEAAVAYLEGGGERRFVTPLLDHFGNVALSAIDQAAIDRAAAVIHPKGGPGTRNRHVYTPLSAILKHAATRGMCEFRPVARPRQPKGRIRWITAEEADRLLASCAKHLRPLVTFLLYTGARMSEALYLDWSEIDLIAGEVRFLETKNEEPRGVPLHGRVVEELRKLKRREGAVFRKPNGRAYAFKPKGGGGQIKTAFAGACRRAEIADFSPHDCRHTWATWHYMANRDLTALMKLGGWKSERMVLRYAHVNVGQLKGSIAALPWGKGGERVIAKRKKA